MPTLKSLIQTFLPGSKNQALLNLLDDYDIKLASELGSAFAALGSGWSVSMVDRALETGAECDIESKVIAISKSLTPENQATGFIFELGNAKESGRYKTLNGPWNRQEYKPLQAGRLKSDIEAEITAIYLGRIKLLQKAEVAFAGQARADLEKAKNTTTIKNYLKTPGTTTLRAYQEFFARAPHSNANNAPAIARLPSEEYYAFDFLKNTSDGNLAKLIFAAMTTNNANKDPVMAPIKNLGVLGNQKASCYHFALQKLVELAADKFQVKDGWDLPDSLLDVSGGIGEELPPNKKQTVATAYLGSKNTAKFR